MPRVQAMSGGLHCCAAVISRPGQQAYAVHNGHLRFTLRVSFAQTPGTRRPRTPEEMRRAAAQEWQPLFAQPNPPWAHPLVQTWQDADGLRRGSPNTTLSGHEVELSALLSPGPYQLHSFRNTEVQQLGLLELKVGRWLLRKVGGFMACATI